MKECEWIIKDPGSPVLYMSFQKEVISAASKYHIQSKPIENKAPKGLRYIDFNGEIQRMTV